jgi:hypothetical protein
MAPARALALLLVAAGLYAAIEASVRMPLGTAGAPGPGMLPLALGLILAALAGAALLLQRPRAPAAIARRRVLLVGALLVLYPLLLPRLGFGVATALVLFALARVIAPLPPARLAAFAVGSSILATALFRRLLAVPLPAGPWGF